MARGLNPDVILMAVMMPRGSGIQATWETLLRRPGSWLKALPGMVTAQTAQDCRLADAVGCLPKDDNSPRLLNAIEGVAADG